MPIGDKSFLQQIMDILKIFDGFHFILHFSNVVIYLNSGTGSTDDLLPTINTFMAPTALPIKPAISTGVFLNMQGEVTEKKASPAPTRSTISLEKTGIPTKPSFFEYASDPLCPRVMIILPQPSFLLISMMSFSKLE